MFHLLYNGSRAGWDMCLINNYKKHEFCQDYVKLSCVDVVTFVVPLTSAWCCRVATEGLA